MLEEIRHCQKCGLCFNQKPLLDTERQCQVLWVGLSAKKALSEEEKPLSPQSHTGMLIQKIENAGEMISSYKTNLVKCVPLTEQQKLRYPNKEEMECCFDNLWKEIQVVSPRIVFLLGEKVASFVSARLNMDIQKWEGYQYPYTEYKGVCYVPIHHPSYIYVYKRKEISQYVESIQALIRELI